MNPGIIVQARMSSTRLPGKITRLFYKDKTLLDVILGGLKDLDLPVVLATTDNKMDQDLITYALKHDVLYFEGDENNVLDRFIKAAEKYSFDTVIRVCADNPFVQAAYIQKLLDAYEAGKDDYVSFFTGEGLPVIRTGYGFFAELVSLEALKKAERMTKEALYREHVTNYIYTHPENFRIKKLKMPFEEPGNKIRLTIDTEEDFNLAASLYEKYHSASVEHLLDEISKEQSYLDRMSQQAERNSK